MIKLGLRTREVDGLVRLLKKPHQISVAIMIVDLEHNYRSTITHRMLSGQIDYDLTAEVTRTLNLELSDPRSTLAINPDSPEDGAVFMDRMIKVVYSVADPVGTEWFDIPVFVGPISSVERDNDSVILVAKGKDSMLYSSVWKTKVFKRGHKITQMIRYILREIAGENRMNVPEKDRRLDADMAVGRDAVPIKVIKRHAGAVGFKFFYDGRGVAQLRRPSRNVLHTYDGRNITSLVKWSYNPETVVNAVRVIGAKPKGKKTKVSAEAVAPNAHPLSPERLGRSGVPRYYVLEIEDESLKTDSACKTRAREELDGALKESIEVEFSALPNPLQEEYDLCRIASDDFSFTCRPKKWSLGLTHESQSSMGTIRKVSRRGRLRGGQGPDKKTSGMRNVVRAGTFPLPGGGKVVNAGTFRRD